MEIFLGALIILGWFAVVIWGAVNLVIDARRKNDWGKVGIAVLSATTVGGPLLLLMPEHVFFGIIHTIGLGAVLASISGLAIFANIMFRFGLR